MTIEQVKDEIYNVCAKFYRTHVGYEQHSPAIHGIFAIIEKHFEFKKIEEPVVTEVKKVEEKIDQESEEIPEKESEK